MRKRFSGKNLYRAPLLLGATLMLSACGLWQDSSEPPAQPETRPVSTSKRSLRLDMTVWSMPRRANSICRGWHGTETLFTTQS